ncbi:cysteine desulfurase, partial [Patescibacteria group bacterium]|nr:cysteine desulfurase [Patescibacteria group bacterium]
MNSKIKNRIYLDYAATTPLDPLVVKAMEPYFVTKFGNPNSPHTFGQEALIAVDKAREVLAKFCNCSLGEIIFTSGATESNNLAIRGVIRKYQQIIEKPEIITTRIEHPSVLNTCRDMENQNMKVKYLSTGSDGIVKIANFKKLITDSTALVSVMYANNEIGTIQPIREIGKLLENINKNRKTPVLFHTDAVQAAGTLKCDVDYLHVDLLSLSGHKIYGPKGVGSLYVKNGTPIHGIQTGGDQEYTLRAGTVPVPNIVGFGKAVDLLIYHQEQDKKRMEFLRNWTFEQIVKLMP